MDFSFIEDETLRAQAEEAYNAEQKANAEDIDAKIAEAVEGLKNKNEELLGEKKTIQERLQKYAEIKDPEEALKALKFINESEEAQMIRDGKFDELLEKRTSNMRLEHDNAITELADKLEEITNSKTKYKSLYQTKIMDDALRDVATKAGVRPEAIPDVLLRANTLFSLGSDGSVEARTSDGKLLKNEDGNVVTPSVWMESLKESSPHYWPSSEGSGARGGNITGDADTTEKLAALAKKGDMQGYRKLRSQMHG
jgi:hypothetical protein